MTELAQMRTTALLPVIVTVGALLAGGPAAAQDGGPPFGCDEAAGECQTPETSYEGLDGEGYQSPDDWDDDGVADADDNCPFAWDPDLSDLDDDGYGDLCDNCPNHWNADQWDADGDGIGDACDNDVDNDGVLNQHDNCFAEAADDAGIITREDAYDPLQRDRDGDGLGDACDPDADGDGIDNLEDDCPHEGAAPIKHPCDPDSDADGVPDFGDAEAEVEPDNCPYHANADQADLDGDGVGDACDPDLDDDGHMNSADNCPTIPNPGQEDWDRDRIGGACDDYYCFWAPGMGWSSDAEADGGVVEDCLDPAGEFRVYVPHKFDAVTGEELRLRLFANRVSSSLRYDWRLISGPDESGGIVNPIGGSGYSTPFEYHYIEGRAPTFTPARAGTYTVEVVVQQAWPDAVSGEPNLVVSYRAVIEARGGTLLGSSACDCSHVGAGRSSAVAGLLSALGLLGLGWLARGRRR